MKRLKYILIAALVIFAFIIPGHADFGDFGGDSDFGGGFDSFDSGYDFDDYNDDYDYDDDYDSDYNYNNGNPGYSSGTVSGRDSEGNPLVGVFVLIAFVAIIIICSKKFGKKGSNKPVMPGAQRTDLSAFKPMNEYTNIDPTFSEQDFTEKLSNLYVRFQNSWQDKKLDDVRPYLTDAFYAQLDRQLDAYRRNRQTNRIERIAVLGVNLKGWKQEDGKDVIVAELQTRIVDYVVDDNTGNVIRGDANAEKFMTYEWTLQRTSGMTTAESTGVTAQSCPHCGAPVNINHAATCEYCGAVLTSDTFDWAVSSIKGLSQRTAK